MKIKGPTITLLAGALLAGGLLAANLGTGSEGDVAAATPASASPTLAAPSITTPAATPTVAPADEAATPAAKPVNAVWAGRVKGGGATVAIAVHQGVAIAYVCDGGLIEAWLKGTAADGEIAMKGADGAALVGDFGGGRVQGTVNTDSRTWTFDVPAATKPSGLYRSTQTVRGATVDAGWIVLADGTQVGVLTTDGGDPAPAPRLDTASGTATVNGATVTANAIDETGNGF